ncbi:hypothetical protein CONCODRAFT_19175 [Conidiobolus coronatus NRRL 28638]|uniref:Uncharacterized protein n=1 Tax=Conidiobolus coronatus (strain ATCC 28846 / CBS 209.66 / NRRL 28638) TaxID=796925 RepID=A0A137NZ99_CONC2|nr:hypothetical protein CONCODRAFT_19175 [Conidiobolus coronatus NRRL 28638]|eukprot:KXN68146.1 hypothetical protein CONCODRAFT_19175 [Conidiobolus coronatus NRRL 28638]
MDFVIRAEIEQIRKSAPNSAANTPVGSRIGSPVTSPRTSMNIERPAQSSVPTGKPFKPMFSNHESVVYDPLAARSLSLGVLEELLLGCQACEY